ncbi:hypothetical protein HC723_16250 [Vibrio sp. S11_S32]|uniref:AbrB/MazE/SpoVT family DNA-binding domain-containing protein n=1 Tax=Vibrio sp. S11_S32 TaxID=2720225 RepID=UPI0016809E07|nr:hypothetical protein [Vibrio sp. S11_S32]MBD1577942.1 hypothetical protein [Vibrio sp. S11_S32]
MKKITKIRAIGNSAGCLIPAAIVHKANMNIGDEYQLSVDSGNIIFEPVLSGDTHKLIQLIKDIETFVTGDDDLSADLDKLRNKLKCKIQSE